MRPTDVRVYDTFSVSSGTSSVQRSKPDRINGIANINATEPVVVYRDYPEDFNTPNKTIAFGMEEFEQRFTVSLFDSETKKSYDKRSFFCMPTDGGFAYSQNRQASESPILNPISSLSLTLLLSLLVLVMILKFLLQMIIQISWDQ